MVKTLREYISNAEEKGVAIGHFNVSNIEALHGIYNAAKKLNVPIIIGVSEGEEEFIGKDEIAVLVKMIRERDNYPIFLNADHHYSFESVKKALDTGYDAAIIDAVKLPLEENIILTKKCVDYAKELNQKEEKDILIEAELGFIGSGSEVKNTIPEGAGILTKVEDAKKFVEETGVDMLAPSVGSVHGLIKSGKPHIDAELVREIREAVGIPLVLHGGSGLRDEDFTSAIKAGISIIHINTEIRVAYKEALEKYLKENPNEVAPYKILKSAVEAIEQVVYNRLKLFNNL